MMKCFSGRSDLLQDLYNSHLNGDKAELKTLERVKGEEAVDLYSCLLLLSAAVGKLTLPCALLTEP